MALRREESSLEELARRVVRRHIDRRREGRHPAGGRLLLQSGRSCRYQSVVHAELKLGFRALSEQHAYEYQLDSVPGR